MDAPAPVSGGLAGNAEATAAWDGPLFDRFVQFREIVTTGLGAHGDAALAVLDPQPGERVLDIGCGFGDATRQLAALVGPGGTATGVDVSPRFIELAAREAAEGGASNAAFRALDVEVDELGGPYDVAFSRFGTMFFAGPVRAMRNVRAALKPGGRLAMVVWRRRMDNDWLYRGQTIVEGIVTRPEEYDEPTCGPGPFSMADADTTTEILIHAGFEQITLQRCDLPIMIGRDLEEAIEMVMAIGPAAEILRLQGERADHLHEPIRAALEAGIREFEGPDGLIAPASTWIVSATVPR
jgi:SAM-dependent methyltransferase